MKKAASKVALLDVNVLLALAWPNHQFHASASRRMAGARRWATCALTELSFIRLSCTRAVVGEVKTPIEASVLLGALTAASGHEFWGQAPSPGKIGIAWEHVPGAAQTTDAYLLALARAHRALLLTFDRRLLALAGAGEVEVLGA